MSAFGGLGIWWYEAVGGFTSKASGSSCVESGSLPKVQAGLILAHHFADLCFKV